MIFDGEAKFGGRFSQGLSEDKNSLPENSGNRFLFFGVPNKNLSL